MLGRFSPFNASVRLRKPGPTLVPGISSTAVEESAVLYVHVQVTTHIDCFGQIMFWSRQCACATHILKYVQAYLCFKSFAPGSLCAPPMEVVASRILLLCLCMCMIVL